MEDKLYVSLLVYASATDAFRFILNYETGKFSGVCIILSLYPFIQTYVVPGSLQYALALRLFVFICC